MFKTIQPRRRIYEYYGCIALFKTYFIYNYPRYYCWIFVRHNNNQLFSGRHKNLANNNFFILYVCCNSDNAFVNPGKNKRKIQKKEK
jgi:hypothetical protein